MLLLAVSFIAGILTAMLIVVFDIYLLIKSNSITERVIDYTQSKVRRGGTILDPPDPSAEAMKEIFDKNDELGVDTKLSDIFK